jgi:hypothetical protein
LDWYLYQPCVAVFSGRTEADKLLNVFHLPTAPGRKAVRCTDLAVLNHLAQQFNRELYDAPAMVMAD